MCHSFECGTCKDVLIFTEIILEFWIEEIWARCPEATQSTLRGNSVSASSSDDVAVILCRSWVKTITNVQRGMKNLGSAKIIIARTLILLIISYQMGIKFTLIVDALADRRRPKKKNRKKMNCAAYMYIIYITVTDKGWDNKCI